MKTPTKSAAKKRGLTAKRPARAARLTKEASPKPKTKTTPTAKRTPRKSAVKPAATPAAPPAVTTKPLDLATLKAPGRLEQLDPTKIDVNPHNPRRQAVDEKAQADFEESIATQGILEPVLVRPVPAGAALSGRAPYQLVAGERRFKAALKAIAAKKLPADYRIPAMVKDLDNRQARLVALAENLARADMHPFDECREFAAAEDLGTTPAEIAKATGAHLRNVQRRIKTWRDLPEDGKTAFAADKITFSQAHALAQIAHEQTKLAVMREVVRSTSTYDRQRMNEDWIRRRAESVKRAYDQREADKANPKAAAKRKAERERLMAPYRSHERKITYPTPNAADIYEWPAKIRDREIYEMRREFSGEVVEIDSRAVAIRKNEGQHASGHVYAGGYVIRIKGWPPLEEPITAKNGTAHSWNAWQAAETRAIAALLDTPPKAGDTIARAWLRDTARIVGEINDAKVRKAHVEKLDALQARLFPTIGQAADLTAKPGASPEPVPATGKGKMRAIDAERAAGPVASPDTSAPLTEKLAVPPVGIDGLRLVGQHDHEKGRNTTAKLAGVPDFVLIEKGGRTFSYGFVQERSAAKQQPGGAISVAPSREASQRAPVALPAAAE